MDGGLVQLGITHGLLDRLEGALEEVGAEFLEPSASDRGVEVDALEERINFNVGLGRCRQGSLSSLAGSSQTTDSSLVALDVLLVLALELVDEVIDHPVVKVLTAKVSVTGSRLNFEDAVLNGEDRHIKGAATKVEDEDVGLLTLALLLVKTVSDGSSGRFIDDTEDVKARDDTGILGGLTLGVVEVLKR